MPAARFLDMPAVAAPVPFLQLDPHIRLVEDIATDIGEMPSSWAFLDTEAEPPRYALITEEQGRGSAPATGEQLPELSVPCENLPTQGPHKRNSYYLVDEDLNESMLYVMLSDPRMDEVPFEFKSYEGDSRRVLVASVPVEVSQQGLAISALANRALSPETRPA